MEITIMDIAKKANVSHTTVSRVINNSGKVSNKTKLKIEQAISELGYVPNAYARGLSRRETNVVGLIIPEIRNAFFGEIIEGVTSIADKNDLNVLLFNTDENAVKEKRALRILQEYRIRGLIITPATAHKCFDVEYINAFQKMKIPVVLVDRNIPQTSFDGVYCDDTQAIFDATSLLIREGHRDIAVLGGNMKLDLARNRIAGYRNAFEYHSLPVNERNITYGDFTKSWACDTTAQLLSRNKIPTAIVATNNTLTIGCLSCLTENKMKIPEDISVIGYDKLKLLETVQAKITLVERNVIEYGQNAMQLLSKRMETPEMAPQKVVLRAHLIQRGSEKLILK